MEIYACYFRCFDKYFYKIRLKIKATHETKYKILKRMSYSLSEIK